MRKNVRAEFSKSIPLGYIHLIWTFHSMEFLNWSPTIPTGIKFSKSLHKTLGITKGRNISKKKYWNKEKKDHALCEIFHVLCLYLLHCFNEWNGRELICFKLLRVSKMFFYSVHKCNEYAFSSRKQYSEFLSGLDRLNVLHVTFDDAALLQIQSNVKIKPMRCVFVARSFVYMVKYFSWHALRIEHCKRWAVHGVITMTSSKLVAISYESFGLIRSFWIESSPLIICGDTNRVMKLMQER